MAILIKRDGSQQLVQPANGVVFSQEEIMMYADLGWVLMGTGEEMIGKQDRNKWRVSNEEWHDGKNQQGGNDVRL